MEAPDKDTSDPSPWRRLAHALPGLVSALRRADFGTSTAQYLAACDLVLSFAAQGRQPGAAELRAALGGVFCTSADEQARFAESFDLWYARLGVEAARAGPAEPVSSPRQPKTWLRLSRVGRFRLWTASAAVSLLITGLLIYLFWPPESELEEQASISAPSPALKELSVPGVLPRSSIPEPEPRQPLELVVPPTIYTPAWVPLLRLTWLVPVFLWLLWVVHRLLLRHVVLKRRAQQPGEEIRLDHLHLAGDRGGLFDTPALEDTWRYLRQFRSMQSRHLNEAATVDRTLEAGGYFHPVFRERQVPPAYLLLVDRRHCEDHAATIAGELGRAMRRESIQVSVFHYCEDPRYCVPAGQVAGECGPSALAGVYADRNVLLVGDGDALFEPETGAARSWLQDFASFEGKLMLTFEPVWRQGERVGDLTGAGFRLLPLTTEGLAQIGETDQAVGGDDIRDWPTPRRFAVDPARWLEDRPMPRARLKAALEDLEAYLGREGFLLLSATAAYPGLYWGLTRALDAQLGLTAPERGQRLRKLTRLPWYRYARMPNYLRVALLRGLPRDQLRRITDAYAALLEHRDERTLRLPVAVPDWKGATAALREFLQSIKHHQPLADRVFASVVRGRRPRPLEFTLPARFTWHLPTSRWRGLVLPLLSGLLLAPAAIWLNAILWQAWGKLPAELETPLAPGPSGEMVDCLLPGQIKRRQETINVGHRRPIKTTLVDCAIRGGSVAEKGDGKVQYYLGEIYEKVLGAIRGGEYVVFDRADYETARKVWLSDAEKGDSKAQYYLGEIYEKGLGTEPNYTVAAKWYRQAAQQGYAPAQINLGKLFESGLGVPQDSDKALFWYQQAFGLVNLQPLPEPQAHPETPAVPTMSPENEKEKEKAPGPVIELIEPLVPERGIAVIRTEHGSTERVIMGRVRAPGGLIALTVNDQDTFIDANGMFKARVPVHESGSEVVIVAVDKAGQRAVRWFRFELAEPAEPAEPAPPLGNFGNYYALVIGNENYSFLPKLPTARYDAKAVAEILRTKYGFKVTTLLDADRYQILTTLNQLRETLTEDDNLLIYFAGHGDLDKVNDRGHWLAVDAEPDSTANWISNVAITDILNVMSARHILVVADTAYSGTLQRSVSSHLRAGETDEARAAYIQSVRKKRSRTALTSGGLAPVLDAGREGHSVFANAFIDSLRSNEEAVLEAQRLFLDVAARVTQANYDQLFEQVPEYAPIKFTRHEAGDFFFVLAGESGE